MPERLTVARCRTHLARFVYDADNKFILKLNEATSRLVGMGDWLRSNFTQELPVYDGCLVLPRRAEAMLGWKALPHGSPRTTYPMAHEYSEVGPGDADATLPMSNAVELPNVSTFRKITTPGVLTVNCIAADAGKTIRIYGRDADKEVISDATTGEPGELVTMVSGDTSTLKSFAYVDAVERQVTKGYVSLKSGATVIGRYEPGEISPNYRCYKIGPHEQGVKALCSLAHVDAVTENDFVFPPNLGAIKNALQAILMEDDHDNTSAQEHFALAVGFLNAAGTKLRGATVPSPPRYAGPPPIPSIY